MHKMVVVKENYKPVIVKPGKSSLNHGKTNRKVYRIVFPKDKEDMGDKAVLNGNSKVKVADKKTKNILKNKNAVSPSKTPQSLGTSQ